MTGPRRFWLVAALALALLGRTGLPSHAQPADESPAAMDARLAAAAVTGSGRATSTLTTRPLLAS
jgi:hypothetical protein